jgi:5-methylcytosine-specific restriction enzyme A
LTAERIDAGGLARSAVGKTVYTIDRAEPNRILSVENGSILVGTRRSPSGSPVPVQLVQDAADALIQEGEIRISPASLGHRRSSFVGALLATDPRVAALVGPQRLRIKGRAQLSALLERVLNVVGEPRSTEALNQADPLYSLVVHEFRDAVAEVVGDELSYKTQGSAGRGNWAETPWVAIFDVNVTTSATRGYYIVYLFRRDGTGASLSLNQGTTAVYRMERRGFEATLAARARSFAGYLGRDLLAGLDVGRIDLGGGRPPLTPGYEAGSIASITYRQGEVPPTPELEANLRRMLGLYRELVERADELEADAQDNLPTDPQEFEEARRLRWHQRAEGRNRAAVKEAKRLQGYRCRGCGVDFDEQLGEVGHRCIDAHHLVPFHELGEGARRLNPLDDFVIVCCNCHRLLHSETEPLDLDALQEILTGGRTGVSASI